MAIAKQVISASTLYNCAMKLESIWRRFWHRRADTNDNDTGAPASERPVRAEIQSERPISRAAEDRLDRATFANRVASVLSERPGADSVVVGLYGPWGDGKTSALSMIKEALGADPSVVIVEYNPWFFSSDTEAITRSFFLTIGEALEQSGFFSKENVGELLATYGGIIPKVGDAARKLGEAMSLKQLTNVRDHVERILERHQKRVVVFVDDIDRLDRKEIQTLFKLVRLSGDFPYTSYVLAFDDSVVTDALAEAYGGGDTQAGRRFLEKIIQVPLHLPPANPETLRTMVFESCDRVLTASGIELDETRTHEFANLFATGFQHVLTTPRQVKLYDNALTFAVPMLKDEINVTDQMLIEAVRIFHPTVYAFIRDNSGRFLKAPEREQRQQRQEVGAILRDVLGAGALTEDAFRALERVIEHLFPRASRMGYGSEWDETWSKEKRICASGYFRRYFAYAVPAGDLADAAVTEIVAAAERGDGDRLSEIWLEAKENRATDQLISKLRLQEDTVPIDAIPGLALLVAGLSDQIRRTREPFTGDYAFRQAAILIAHLLARAGGVQIELLREMIAGSPQVIFAMEVLDWCKQRISNGEPRGFLPEETTAPLYRALWERLLSEAHERSLLDVLGDDLVRTLFGFVHGGLEVEVRAQVRELLADSDGATAVALLAAFTPRSWDMASGAPRRSDFERSTYDAIIRVADPEQVLAKLAARFGDALETDEYPYLRDDAHADLGLVHAQQFLLMHRHVLAEPQRSQEDDGEADEMEES